MMRHVRHTSIAQVPSTWWSLQLRHGSVQKVENHVRPSGPGKLPVGAFQHVRPNRQGDGVARHQDSAHLVQVQEVLDLGPVRRVLPEQGRSAASMTRILVVVVVVSVVTAAATSRVGAPPLVGDGAAAGAAHAADPGPPGGGGPAPGLGNLPARTGELRVELEEAEQPLGVLLPLLRRRRRRRRLPTRGTVILGDVASMMLLVLLLVAVPGGGAVMEGVVAQLELAQPGRPGLGPEPPPRLQAGDPVPQQVQRPKFRAPPQDRQQLVDVLEFVPGQLEGGEGSVPLQPVQELLQTEGVVSDPAIFVTARTVVAVIGITGLRNNGGMGAVVHLVTSMARRRRHLVELVIQFQDAEVTVLRRQEVGEGPQSHPATVIAGQVQLGEARVVAERVGDHGHLTVAEPASDHVELLQRPVRTEALCQPLEGVPPAATAAAGWGGIIVAAFPPRERYSPKDEFPEGGGMGEALAAEDGGLVRGKCDLSKLQALESTVRLKAGCRQGPDETGPVHLGKVRQNNAGEVGRRDVDHLMEGVIFGAFRQ